MSYEIAKGLESIVIDRYIKDSESAMSREAAEKVIKDHLQQMKQESFAKELISTDEIFGIIDGVLERFKTDSGSIKSKKSHNVSAHGGRPKVKKDVKSEVLRSPQSAESRPLVKSKREKSLMRANSVNIPVNQPKKL